MIWRAGIGMRIWDQQHQAGPAADQKWPLQWPNWNNQDAAHRANMADLRTNIIPGIWESVPLGQKIYKAFSEQQKKDEMPTDWLRDLGKPTIVLRNKSVYSSRTGSISYGNEMGVPYSLAPPKLWMGRTHEWRNKETVNQINARDKNVTGKMFVIDAVKHPNTTSNRYWDFSFWNVVWDATWHGTPRLLSIFRG